MTKIESVRSEIARHKRELKRLLRLQACQWRRATKQDSLNLGFVGLRGAYVCKRCSDWTANLPLYRGSICRVKKGVSR